jgi:hypothetical protein
MCVMKTLARIAVFTALIGGVSLANARADGNSVYVAGKGKYCKETAVSGYLDCFYASLDACEKQIRGFVVAVSLRAPPLPAAVERSSVTRPHADISAASPDL